MQPGGVRQQGVTPSTDFEEEEVGPTRQRDSLVGQQLGEYLVEARLGEGAMGIVYRGLQPLIGRPVAIKVLKPGFDDAGELLEEARAVSSARHPNIIDVFSYGQTAQGQKYFVMELLAGEALDLWLRERTVTPLEVVGILKQLLSGLAAAHAANVVHRDLKPGNLFMARLADGSHFLKILDFGLAKRVDPLAPEKTIGRMAGTPLYMAPEQTRGQLTGPFTDLYAVGCIAFELLSGRPPFSSPNLAELLMHHQSSPPPPLPAELPPLLDELVRTLMEKEPARRPASAIAARQVLERVERRLLVAAGTNTALPAQPASRARPLKVEPEAAPSRPRRPPEERRSVKEVRDRATTPSLPAAEPRPTLLSLEDSDDDAVAATSLEMKPMAAPQRRWWLLAVPLGLALAAGLVLLWPAAAPPPILEVTPVPVAVPPAAAPVPVPAPAPAPEREAAEEAPVRPAVRPAPAAKSGPNLQARLRALEERCLLELTESRQRMALEDLRELRGELANAPQQANTQLAAFETRWLKKARP